MPWDEREKNRGTQWRGNVNSRSRNEGIQEQQISYPVAKNCQSQLEKWQEQSFRNGMRLEPNASEIIEPGDEIGIGKLKFIYR